MNLPPGCTLSEISGPAPMTRYVTVTGTAIATVRVEESYSESDAKAQAERDFVRAVGDMKSRTVCDACCGDAKATEIES